MNYLGRLEKLRSLLQELPCDAVLIEEPTNLFYLTGLHFSAGQLLITQHQALLVVDGRYIESAKQQKIYPCALIKENLLKEWLISHSVKKLGFDKHHTSYSRFLELQTLLNPIAIDPIDSPVEKLRFIKEEEEIEALRQAAQLGNKGYNYLLTLLKEGIQERELALELEFFWKKAGAEGIAFESIIAFNANSSMPHHRAGRTELKKNSVVLIDCGVLLSNYNSDMTRVVFFGEPPQEIKKIYPIVREAQEKALLLCKPGTPIGDLDQAARGWITNQGYGEYFNHNLGHGVGLQIHEAPRLRSSGAESSLLLQPGMVITIEPGIYLPGIGGVRWEDTIVITDKGYEALTLKT